MSDGNLSDQDEFTEQIYAKRGRSDSLGRDDNGIMNFNDMDYDKDYKRKDTFTLRQSPAEIGSKPRPNFNDD